MSLGFYGWEAGNEKKPLQKDGKMDRVQLWGATSYFPPQMEKGGVVLVLDTTAVGSSFPLPFL